MTTLAVSCNSDGPRLPTNPELSNETILSYLGLYEVSNRMTSPTGCVDAYEPATTVPDPRDSCSTQRPWLALFEVAFEDFLTLYAIGCDSQADCMSKVAAGYTGGCPSMEFTSENRGPYVNQYINASNGTLRDGVCTDRFVEEWTMRHLSPSSVAMERFRRPLPDAPPPCNHADFETLTQDQLLTPCDGYWSIEAELRVKLQPADLVPRI